VACETMCTFFNVFLTFFSKSKKTWLFTFFWVVAHVFPNSATGWHKCHPSDENLSLSDWDFWPTGWEAFPLCSIQ